MPRGFPHQWASRRESQGRIQSRPQGLVHIQHEGNQFQNFGGSGCYFSFLINDELAARLDTAERAVFHVTAGNYKLQVTYDWNGRGLCRLGHSESQARTSGQIRDVTLKAGRSYDFRIGFNAWGGVMRLYTDEVGRPISKDAAEAKQKPL